MTKAHNKMAKVYIFFIKTKKQKLINDINKIKKWTIINYKTHIEKLHTKNEIIRKEIIKNYSKSSIRWTLAIKYNN